MCYKSKSAKQEIEDLKAVCEKQYIERSALDEQILETISDTTKFLSLCSTRRNLNARYMANRVKLLNLTTNEPRNGRSSTVPVQATLTPNFNKIW